MERSKQTIIFIGSRGSGKTWYDTHRLADIYTH